MKKNQIIFLCLAFVFFWITCFSTSLHGQEKQDLKNDWREGYTLVLLDNTDEKSINEARQLVIDQGGKIAIMSPPHVMMGWIAPEMIPKLIGKMGIMAIHNEVVDISAMKFQDSVTVTALRFFNYVVSGQSQTEEVKATNAHLTAKPLNSCVKDQPIINPIDVVKNLQKFGITPSITGNSDYMTGTVAVTLFFVESNGQIDPNEFTWRWIDQQFTILRAMGGLSWWSNRATEYGENVSFTVYFYGADDPICQQGYEPIRHPSTDDYRWISAIMGNLGFTSGDYIERVTAFNAWWRNESGMDWAYSVFIGYNPVGAPDTLTDGKFAYAIKGGPYSQMLFINDGWGEDNFGLILTHETGHIFWACDEYYQADYGGCIDCGVCAYAPGRSIDNGNCEYCNPNAVPCMMRFNSDELCKYTPLQIGWQLKTWVDFNYVGTELGTFAQPYNTFLEGINNVPTDKWLWIKEGQSNESGNFPMTINKKMTIKPYYNGSAIIGY